MGDAPQLIATGKTFDPVVDGTQTLTSRHEFVLGSSSIQTQRWPTTSATSSNVSWNVQSPAQSVYISRRVTVSGALGFTANLTLKQNCGNDPMGRFLTNPATSEQTMPAAMMGTYIGTWSVPPSWSLPGFSIQGGTFACIGSAVPGATYPGFINGNGLVGTGISMFNLGALTLGTGSMGWTTNTGGTLGSGPSGTSATNLQSCRTLTILMTGRNLASTAFPFNSSIQSGVVQVNSQVISTTNIQSLAAQKKIIGWNDELRNLATACPSAPDAYDIPTTTMAMGATSGGEDMVPGFIPNGAYNNITFYSDPNFMYPLGPCVSYATAPTGTNGYYRTTADALGNIWQIDQAEIQGGPRLTLVSGTGLGTSGVLTAAGAGEVTFPVYFTVNIANEPLLLPPFTLSNDEPGLVNINQLGVRLQMADPSLQASCPVRIAPFDEEGQVFGAMNGGDNYGSCIIGMEKLAWSATKPIQNLTLNTDFLSPSQATPTPERALYPFVKWEPSITPVIVNLPAGSDIRSTTLTLPLVPDALVVFIDRGQAGLDITNINGGTSSSSATRTIMDRFRTAGTDCFAPITHLEVNWNNNGQILSSADAYDLHKRTYENGIHIPFPVFNGDAIAYTAPPNSANRIVYKGAGGPLLLVMGKDIATPLGYSGGVAGNFSLQVTVRSSAIGGPATSPFSLVVVPINTQWLVTRTGGLADLITSVSTPLQCISAPEPSVRTANVPRHLVGGGWLKNGFSKISSAAQSAAPYVMPLIKQYGPGLAAQVADSVHPGAGQLVRSALGRGGAQSGGGAQSAGGLLGGPGGKRFRVESAL